MSLSYTTVLTDTALSDHTRVWRAYDTGGGVLLNILTKRHFTDRVVPVSDVELFVPGVAISEFGTAPTALLDEDLGYGFHRYVRAVGLTLGVVVHSITHFIRTNETRLVRELAYFVAGGSISGGGIVVPPYVPPSP